jgi:hypothetical protein
MVDGTVLRHSCPGLHPPWNPSTTMYTYMGRVLVAGKVCMTWRLLSAQPGSREQWQPITFESNRCNLDEWTLLQVRVPCCLED